MQASFFSEYCLYAAVRGFGAVVRRLPLAWALGVGRAFGVVAYWTQPKRRAVSRGNLRAALGRERSPEALEAIGRGTFQHLGMSLIELLRAPRVDAAYVRRWITVEGREHLEQALAQRRGLIVVSGHLGNWELASLVSGVEGHPVLALVRQQGLPRLNRLLNRCREVTGCRVVTKGMGLRDLVRHLQAGGLVGLVADQDAGARGVLAPFFGRLASTARGPVALAVRTRAPVLPVFCLRTRGPRHTIIFERPLPVGHSGDEAREVQAGIAAYLQVLERYIRRAPDQWLWGHRRWKSSPHRAVAVLSDGKAGHRTQAEAVAEFIERIWEERARRDPRLAAVAGPWTQRRVLEVRYRSPWRRTGLWLAAATGVAPCWPAWWLRWALAPASARALQHAWATVTVSCGTGAGIVNMVWGGMLGARVVHLLRPPWRLARQAALLIVPRHDGIRPGPRTVVTRGALHAIRPAALAAEAEHQRRRWSLSRAVQIGILIGGDTRGVRLTPETVGTVIAQALDAARQMDAELLVTTSRRTAPSVEQLLERRLDLHPRCPLFVLASRDATPGYVPGILAAATVLIVSGESISMVSEAAASGKPVLVFEPSARTPWPKYRRLLSALARDGAVRIVQPGHIGRALLEMVQQDRPAPAVDDGAMIMERLRQWL